MKTAPLISILFTILALCTPAQAQDAQAGEKVFKKCKSCHQIGTDAKNGAGPALNDIIGRTAGSVDGFRYGRDLVSAGENGLVWSEETLAEYIADPRQFLRSYLDNPKAKAKMAFKLSKEQDRVNVAAYLADPTLKAAGETTVQADVGEPVETRTVEEVVAAQVFTAEFMANEANIEKGKELWFAQCTHCHGYKAYPGKAPKLKAGKYKPEFVFKRVYKGFKKMPEWRETFTIDEIRTIVTYVKSKKFSP